MLKIDNLHYAIGGRALFEDATAHLATGHRYGVVGDNGTGKSTLLKLIAGDLHPDQGSITLHGSQEIARVAQEAPASNQSILDMVLEAHEGFKQLNRQIDIASPDDRIHLEQRRRDLGWDSAPARAAKLLSGLGFSSDLHDRPTAEFSGGWRMRIALAGVLFSAPDLLLLDEPSNYLDLEGTLWLENYLKSFRQTAIIVSHDRTVLENSVTDILHLQDQKLTTYSGNYSRFIDEYQRKSALAEKHAQKTAEKRAHLQSFVDRFRAKASKAKQAQSRLKMLERLTDSAQASATTRISFPIQEVEDLSPPILSVLDAAVGYGDTTVLSKINLRVDQTDRVALLGLNGAGKSTFIKLITGNLPAQKGEVKRHPRLRIGYFAQHQLDQLDPEQTAFEHIKALRPESAESLIRSQLAQIGLGEGIVDLPVTRLSGGQRARLALLQITLDQPHVLILDEPTNHLDLNSREALATALNAFNGAVIIVSHDPYLIGLVAERLVLIKDGHLREFKEDLEAYQTLIVKSGTKSGAEDKPALAKKRLSASERRKILAPLQAELSKCEARIEKLTEMEAELNRRLADPALYAGDQQDKVQSYGDKLAEVKTAIDKAEALWINAQDLFDQKKLELGNG